MQPGAGRMVRTGHIHMYDAQWFPPAAKNVPHRLQAQHVNTNESASGTGTSAPVSCAAALPACNAAVAVVVDGVGESCGASSLGRSTIGSAPEVASQILQDPSAETATSALGKMGC